jgi:hypothetical protein
MSAPEATTDDRGAHSRLEDELINIQGLADCLVLIG